MSDHGHGGGRQRPRLERQPGDLRAGPQGQRRLRTLPAPGRVMGRVPTSAQVRLLNRYTMAGINELRVLADHRDGPPFATPNDTDLARGMQQPTREEWVQVKEIVRTLVEAVRPDAERRALPEGRGCLVCVGGRVRVSLGCRLFSSSSAARWAHLVVSRGRGTPQRQVRFLGPPLVRIRCKSQGFSVQTTSGDVFVLDACRNCAVVLRRERAIRPRHVMARRRPVRSLRPRGAGTAHLQGRRGQVLLLGEGRRARNGRGRQRRAADRSSQVRATSDRRVVNGTARCWLSAGKGVL